MQPLKLNRFILSLLCLYPNPEGTGAAVVLAKRIFAIQCFVFTAIGLVGTSAYVYYHVTTDLEKSLFAILSTAALIYVNYTQIFARFLRQNIFNVIEQLTKFYQFHRTNEQMYGFLVDADEDNHRFTILYFKVIFRIKFVAATILLLKIMIFSFLVGMDKFHNATYQIQIFWDEESASGKIFIALFCMYSGGMYLFVNAAFITFFVGICKQCNAFYNQFQYLIENLKSNGRRKSLHELMQYHQSTKEIYFQTSDLFSVFIWIAITCSIVHTSCSIFQLDLAISNDNEGALLDCIMCLLASLSNLFLYCNFGGQATDSFDRMSDALYNSEWIKFKPEFQKYLVVAIANTQRPLYYHGFHIIELNLETFTQVLKTVYSYYMMFKTLTERNGKQRQSF